jgi:hypothetical protein
MSVVKDLSKPDGVIIDYTFEIDNAFNAKKFMVKGYVMNCLEQKIPFTAVITGLYSEMSTYLYCEDHFGSLYQLKDMTDISFDQLRTVLIGFDLVKPAIPTRLFIIDKIASKKTGIKNLKL